MNQLVSNLMKKCNNRLRGWNNTIFRSPLHILFFCGSVAPQPISSLRRLIVDISRSHTDTHTRARSEGFLWTSDQLVEEADICTTHKKHKRRTFMPLAEFAPAIPANKRRQTARPRGSVFLYFARCIQAWRNPYDALTQLTLGPAAFQNGNLYVCLPLCYTVL